MKKRQNRPQVFTAKPGTLPVDVRNDLQMVRERLRQPKLVSSQIVRRTDEERARLANEKALYSRMKNKFPALYNESRQEIIQTFLDSKLPRWGSFKFFGKQV